MSKHFGKTWWGQQWLNSLSNIDYSNRLPRGSTYARNGSVTNITIDGNSIRAKVKGSQRKPYDITIIIPPFFDPEIKKLIKAIADKPVIISKLLNRELDPELLQIAEHIGLKVFPRQWTDFKMQCSCPDWAVPCKHLASIIYKISAEIDNNPFLVFQLHKVDLPKELQKENVFIPPSGNTDVPTFVSQLKNQVSKEVIVKGKESSKNPTDNLYRFFDFSTLTNIAEPIIQLLPDAPVFYQNTGNFKEKYAVSIRKATRNAQRVLTGKAILADYLTAGVAPRKLTATRTPDNPLINHHTDVYFVLDENNGVAVYLDNTKSKVPLKDIIVALWEISPAHVIDYQPSVAVLRTALLLAVNLIANGGVVPQIVRLENKLFALRWLPAMLSREIGVLADKLQQLLPDGILRLSETENVTHQTAVNLLSVFLDAFIHAFCQQSSGDIFLDFFFSKYKYAFNAPGQEALPGGINNWLQRYYLTQGKYKPAIIVEELLEEKFQLIINIEEQGSDKEKAVMLRDVMTLQKFSTIRFDVLQSFTQISSFIPGLDHYINSKGDQPIIMDINEFAPFLVQAIPAIQLLNINILLPKSLQHILKPKANVRIKQKSKDNNTGFLRLDKLLDFDWQVAIGDTVLNEDEFKKLLKNSEGLIRYKKQYIYVSPSDLEKLYKHFNSSKELTAFEMLRAALSNDYHGANISLTDEVKVLISKFTEQHDIALPAGLSAQLRPYQHRGFSWMYRNTQVGFGSVIADDMGLGKTLQVIATLLKFKEDGMLKKEKALVVTPTGLLTNWQAEIEKFAPELKYMLYHGPGRKLGKNDEYDVLLTSYGVARSEAAELKKMKWHVLAIDEAQNIKNHETGQSKALKSIPANTFIAMSGTPVENRLSELWSIMDFCNRGFLGGLPEFKETFANPIQNQQDVSVANKLKTITSPFLMRRLKSDKSIISDLPDKIEMDCFASLAKQQASLYEKTLHEACRQLRK